MKLNQFCASTITVTTSSIKRAGKRLLFFPSSISVGQYEGTMESMIHLVNPQLEKYLNTLFQITEAALTEQTSIF